VDYLLVTARIARQNLRNMDVTRFQRAALRRGLVQHPDDRMPSTLEQAMRYSAMIGWMAFNQMATMNARIPLFGDGNFEQLQGDIVDHDERLEELERRRESHEEDLNRLYNQDWDEVEELHGRVDTLERTLEMTQVALGRATVEMVRLRAVTNTNNTRLVAVLHGRDNLVLVESSPEPEAGPSRFPQLGEDNPHRLVPIEDLGSVSESEEDEIFDEDRVERESMTSRQSSPVL
jgi:hypothetical protein